MRAGSGGSDYAVGAMRIDAAEFLALDLEVHALLADVPLRDVSAVDLPDGGEGRTIADVLYAPGLRDLSEIRSLVAAVERPVNVLIVPGGPSVPELFEAGASRVSVGGAIAIAANAAALEAARELLTLGTHTFWSRAIASVKEIHAALD